MARRQPEWIRRLITGAELASGDNQPGPVGREEDGDSDACPEAEPFRHFRKPQPRQADEKEWVHFEGGSERARDDSPRTPRPAAAWAGKASHLMPEAGRQRHTEVDQ